MPANRKIYYSNQIFTQSEFQKEIEQVVQKYSLIY